MPISWRWQRKTDSEKVKQNTWRFSALNLGHKDGKAHYNENFIENNPSQSPSIDCFLLIAHSFSGKLESL